MKKTRLFAALAAMMLLTACGGGDNPSSSAPSTDSGTAASTASESSAPSGTSLPSASDSQSSPSSGTASSSISYVTVWSEEDLDGMALAFDALKNVVLPVPAGLTTSYDNLTIQYYDETGYFCFVIGDSECGDLTASYGKQLSDAGLVYFGTHQDTGFTYAFYQYCLPDSLEAISVELRYYTEPVQNWPTWMIVAYYDEEGGTYFDDTFPYNRIETEFGTTNASEAIPSFSTLEEDGYISYYYFGDTEETTYFVVSGTYAEGSNEATLYNNYKAALVTLGYTVQDGTNDSSGMANSTKFGYYLTIDIYDGVMDLYIQYSAPSPTKGSDVTAPGTTPQVGTKSITMTSDIFPGQYPSGEAEVTVSSVKFGYSSVVSSGGKIQFRSSSRGAGYLWNATSLGTIYSIEIIVDSKEYYGVLSLYLSNSVITSIDGLDYVTPAETSTGYVYNIKGAYSYFYLIDEATYASKNTSITINYTI